MNEEQYKVEQSKLQAMLILKTSIEHNSSINTLALQVINAGNNGKSLKEDKLIQSIKQINREYTQRVEELANALKEPVDNSTK